MNRNGKSGLVNIGFMLFLLKMLMVGMEIFGWIRMMVLVSIMMMLIFMNVER